VVLLTFKTFIFLVVQCSQRGLYCHHCWANSRCNLLAIGCLLILETSET